MCLDDKYRKRKKDRWLKKQPKYIIAYKRVKVVGNKLYAPIYIGEPLKRKNLVRSVKGKKQFTDYSFSDGYSETSYIAFFHLYLDKKDLSHGNKEMIIECKVPKNSITEVGNQDYRRVIVTRYYEIVGQDQYLKDK